MCMDQNLQERAQLPWFTYLSLHVHSAPTMRCDADGDSFIHENCAVQER